MYAQHFGLDCVPFDDRDDPSFFHATPDRDEALAAMLCRIEHGHGGGLTLGEAGTGKSLLIRALLRRLRPEHRAAVIACTPGGGTELLREVCRGLGVTTPSSMSPARMLARLRRQVQRTRQSGIRSVVVIDQAEHLSSHGLAELATLVDLRDGSQRLLTVLLLAQPRFRVMLDRPENLPLKQELFGERTIVPFGESDTLAYIRRRLQAAGAPDPDVIEPEAARRIHRMTGGIPRLINRMGDAALIAAYGEGRPTVGPEIVDELARTTEPGASAMAAEQLGLKSAGALLTGLGGARSRESVAEPEGRSAGAGMPARKDRAAESARTGSPSEAEPIARGTGVESVRRDESADELHPQSDRTYRRVSALLDEVTRSAERIQSSLVDRLGEIERRVGEWESWSAKAADLSAASQRRVEGAEQASARAEQLGARLSSFAAQLAGRADDLQSKIDRLLREASDADAAEARLRETAGRVADIPDDAARCEEQLNARVEQLLEGLDAKVSAMIATAEDRVAAAEEKAAHITAEAERAVAHLDSRLASLSTDVGIEDLSNRLSELRAEVAAVDSRAAEIRERVAAVDSPLARKFEQADELVHRTDEAMQRAGEMQSQIAASLMNLGAGCERVQAARAQAEECREIADRFSFGTKTANQLLAAVAARTEELGRTRASLERLVTRADGCTEGLEVQAETATRLLEQLTAGAVRADETTRRANDVAGRVTAATESAEKAGEHASDQVALLAAAQESAAGLLANFEMTTKEAARVHQMLAGTITHTDERLARLASHQAAAGQAIERLSEATVAAHDAVKRMEATHARIDEAAEAGIQRADQSLSRLSAAAADAESTRGSLNEQNEAVARAMSELHQGLAVAAEVTHDLQGKVAQAIGVSGDLSRQCDQTAVDAVNKLEQAIRDAGDVRARLDGTSERGDELCRRLDETLSAARVSCDQTAEDARAAARTVNQQMAELNTAGGTLEALSSRIHHLDNELAETKTRADRLTVSVAALGEEPRQTMESARKQTAELERVLGAVRKVFSGLSQASLEAKRQAEELDSQGRSAADRLTRLAAYTDKATRTLSQWTEEAIRVQSRLEAALQQAPTIDETHAAESLQEMAESLRTEPVRRGAGEALEGSPATGTRDHTPGDRSGGRCPPQTGSADGRAGPIKQMPARPVPIHSRAPERRAEQIAQILEEVKRGG